MNMILLPGLLKQNKPVTIAPLHQGDKKQFFSMAVIFVMQ